jgi:putative transposase
VGTAEGWLSGSTLLDLYARQGVGWAMSRRIETILVEDTWRMALGRRQPAAGLRHHSDRGSQYASHGYQDRLATHGSVCRMRRQGECLDHAVAERCFGSLTREWTARRYDATRQEARDDIIAYIEMCYNSTRKHSYLGSVSPNEYEQCARVA